MNHKIPLKSIVLGLALTAASAFLFSANDMVETTHALDESEILSENQVCQTSEYETDNEENTSDDYAVTTWWKAVLADYDENLCPGGLNEEEEEPSAEIQTDLTDEISNNDTTAKTDNNTASQQTTTADSSLPVPQQVVRDTEEVKANHFCFKTSGYGHGVGMSQNGANYYATYSGYDYKQILAHYYPGTTLGNTGTAYNEYITVKGITGTPLNIVSMVCYAEIGTSMNPEAIKAQAIAAYTNIKYNGGNTNGMAIKSNPPAELVEIVRSVIGTAVYYDGELALTPFYASSAGNTASCKDVFELDLPYLKSVPSEYDSICDPNYNITTQLSIDTVRYKVQNYLGIKLSNNYANWFSIVRGDGGIAASIVVDGQVTVKGYELCYALGLKSPFVEISYN
ncbi:MAG: hypothetical protein ACI4JM_12455 [Oscillospiraceae bacterium]